jgi:cyclophilin family peptidyl-prolyl cis-trans isomerase
MRWPAGQQKSMALVVGLLLCHVGLLWPGMASAWWPFGTNHNPAPKADSTVRPQRAVSEAPPEAPLDTPYAQMDTQRGTVVIALYPKAAPNTVANFIKLVNRGFYNQNGMTFHRVVPGFVVQTGDPTGTGEGGSDTRIPLEVKNKLSHNTKGTVAMARTAAPNSATSQFYITLTSQRQLDGKYAIFGRVIRGLPVLSQINQGDTVYGIRMITARDLPAEDPKHLLGVPLKAPTVTVPGFLKR